MWIAQNGRRRRLERVGANVSAGVVREASVGPASRRWNRYEGVACNRGYAEAYVTNWCRLAQMCGVSHAE
jgi:hypothetical protein